jgi:bifunctional DNA primase/polymerase-like protein/CHC2-type zinc finger protein
MENDQNKFLKAALWYRKKGLSVIPCKPNSKEALLSWTQYQNQLPTEEQVKAWWTQNPNANIALVLGRVSNVITLEMDDEKAIYGYTIPVTPQAISGGKGLPHIYFRYVEGMRNYKAQDNGRELFSIRGDGLYVVAPPSIHPSGNPYKWRSNLGIHEVDLADPPEWVLELMISNPAKEEAEHYYKQRDNKYADSLRLYIEKLKTKIRMVDLLIKLEIEKTEETVRYTQFNCPFHDSEGKKSFTVWDDVGIGHDWRDEKNYDCIEFIRAYKKVEFKETLNFLADYAELTVLISVSMSVL